MAREHGISGGLMLGFALAFIFGLAMLVWVTTGPEPAMDLLPILPDIEKVGAFDAPIDTSQGGNPRPPGHEWDIEYDVESGRLVLSLCKVDWQMAAGWRKPGGPWVVTRWYRHMGRDEKVRWVVDRSHVPWNPSKARLYNMIKAAKDEMLARQKLLRDVERDHEHQVKVPNE